MIKYLLVGYCLIVFGFLGYFYNQIVRLGAYQEWYIQTGNFAGQVAVGLFLLIVMPRIFREFNLASRIANLLDERRFAIGVAMFVTGLLHYMVVKIFPMLQLGRIVPFMPFEVMGFLALQTTFLWTLLQNNRVNRKLSKFAKYIQILVHVLVWLLFLHVGLQGLSITAVVLLLAAILDLHVALRAAFKRA